MDKKTIPMSLFLILLKNPNKNKQIVIIMMHRYQLKRRLEEKISQIESVKLIIVQLKNILSIKIFNRIYKLKKL